MGALSPRPRLADGGLATTLQSAGLAPATSVNDWVLRHPDRVFEAHRAFVLAGAEQLTAGTFQALPELDARWSEVARTAMDLANQAADGRPVWASVGPWTAAWTALDQRARTQAQHAWSALAETVAPTAAGLLVETFVDLEAGLAALKAVVGAGPVVLSFSPAADGRLHDGTEPAEAVDRALAAGATAVGFNCGTAPEPVVAAITRSGRSALWARPAGDPSDPGRLADALQPVLGSCAVVGGCCGAGPQAIAAIRETL